MSYSACQIGPIVSYWFHLWPGGRWHGRPTSRRWRRSRRWSAARQRSRRTLPRSRRRDARSCWRLPAGGGPTQMMGRRGEVSQVRADGKPRLGSRIWGLGFGLTDPTAWFMVLLPTLVLWAEHLTAWSTGRQPGRVQGFGLGFGADPTHWLNE
jgi:hypothetical protein